MQFRPIFGFAGEPSSLKSLLGCGEKSLDAEKKHVNLTPFSGIKAL